MKFLITYVKNSRNKFASSEMPSIYQNEKIKLIGESVYHNWKNDKNEKFFLIGDIVGIRDKGKILSNFDNFKIFEDQKFLSQIEGRFVVIKIDHEDQISLWTDQFGRVDIYWLQDKNERFLISSSKELFPSNIDFGEIDQNGLAQMLTIYGGRPLKKHTLRKNLNRLGVNQRLSINGGKILIDETKFSPSSTFKKNNYSKLDDYFKIFVEAVRARASETQNIVFLSSGWDSTSILATLSHLIDKNKIECVIGRMRYSERSGVINQFELDRATKMAEYYKVKLHIVDLNYTKGANEVIEEVTPTYKGQEFGALTGYNHWKLAKGASKIAKKGAVVFAGEISDGAHNLGFSQYFSIYHPMSHAFREYSDKMASYLFGPTFLTQLIEGKYEEDPVWKIFMQYHEKTKFDKIKKGQTNIISQLFSAFFLSGGRIPLYSKENCKLLTKKGITLFLTNGEETYLNKFKNGITSKNIYSHYLHLYHSFHWQGGTVATLEHTCDAFDLKCRLPFLDKELIDFLSEMPESWGRGLDINNTKYPLKWMLENKIDYPMNYQSGPHSYLYDVNPSFSHADEIVNSSSFTDIFKKHFRNKDFLNHFEKEYFNLKYIDDLISKYVSGENVHGQELNDILNLGNLLVLKHLH